jgi:cobalt-zinc-cadmium efflux system outer membrane protein
MVFSTRVWAGLALLFLGPVSIQAESLSRADAIKVALEHNPEVLAAHAAWKSEQARALRTWAPPRPELELEFEGLAGALDFGQFEQRSVGVTQSLGFPLRWWQRSKAARLQADAVRLNTFETTRLNTVRNVRVAYDRLLADIGISGLAEEHVQLSRDFLERAQERFEVGDVPQLDVLRAEVALSRLENHLTSSQNAVLKSRTRLNALLGRIPTVSVELADTLSYEPVAFDPKVLAKRAWRQRSDWLGADKILESAKAARRASLFTWVPDFSVGIARQTTNDLRVRKEVWRTEIAIELPLWVVDQRGEIAEESARYSMAIAEKERIRLLVMGEVNTAFLTIQATSKRVVRMKERILPTAGAAYAMARRSYDAGKATYLVLLEAQRDLIETGIEHVETVFDYNAALYDLLHATGEHQVSED